MTATLRLRQINHANRPLKPGRVEQFVLKFFIGVQVKKKTWHARFMKQSFVTAFHRWTHAFSLDWRVPFGRRAHGPRVRRETDEQRVFSETFAHKLAHVPFAALPHLSMARVAKM